MLACTRDNLFFFSSYWQCVNVVLRCRPSCCITETYNRSAKSVSLNVDSLPSGWPVPPLRLLQLSLSLCAARGITTAVLSVRSCGVRERYVIVPKWGSPGVTNICTHANVCPCVRVWQADRVRDEVIWRSEAVHFCEPEAHWGRQELAVQAPAARWLHHICGETLSQRHEGNCLGSSTDILHRGGI